MKICSLSFYIYIQTYSKSKCACVFISICAYKRKFLHPKNLYCIIGIGFTSYVTDFYPPYKHYIKENFNGFAIHKYLMPKVMKIDTKFSYVV